jgi:hypothetical protein
VCARDQEDSLESDDLWVLISLLEWLILIKHFAFEMKASGALPKPYANGDLVTKADELATALERWQLAAAMADLVYPAPFDPSAHVEAADDFPVEGFKYIEMLAGDFADRRAASRTL